MRKLEDRDKKSFYEINEAVAHESPMRTHYNSPNIFERWIWGKKKEIIKSFLRKIKYSTVIDVGCGDGGLFPLLDSNTSYTGVDISPTQLSYFKKSLPKKIKNMPHLIEEDISKLSFKDNTFNLLLACDVLEHVIDPIKVIGEIRRVVKKEGYIIFCIPTEEMLQLVRLLTFRFPLRSPDHIYSIAISDINKYFPHVIKHKGIPFTLHNKINLLNILLVKNDKKK